MKICENGITREMTAAEIAEFERLAAEQPAPEPTAEERLEKVEAENEKLKAQLEATTEQQEFYESCIAEMAEIVYA